MNDSWARAMGYAPAEMLGRTSVELGLWSSPAARAAFALRVGEQQSASEMQVQFRARSGELRDILLASAVIDWEGERAIISSMNDVTERRRAIGVIRRLNESLEQKVRERTTELEASTREMESFSYSVSHDLRAPLGAINGFANILRTKEGARLSPDSAPRHAELRVAPMPPCRGDPILLRQVWRNLIGNAVKYSRNNPSPLIEIGYDEAAAAYRVRDNGVGFDMQYAEKLFGVFERLHSEAEFEGAGIGLAHAARIVARHGGRIWCDAMPEQGATFFFTLPA